MFERIERENNMKTLKESQRAVMLMLLKIKSYCSKKAKKSRKLRIEAG
jgi:hypothetical protein